MSDLTIKRIAGVLDNKFRNRIDLSDWSQKSPPAEKETVFFHRALAALVINRLAEADLDSSAAAVTDGRDDGGIDALYFDPLSDTIFFAQGKWSNNGRTGIDLGDASKFVDGIRKILNDDFASFNARVRNKEAEIRSVLYTGVDVKLRIIVVTTCEQDAPFHPKQRILDFVSELNEPVTVASAEFYSQKETYELVVSEHSKRSIALTISLRQFGYLTKPFLAYYGRVHIAEVARWWRDHKNDICTRNLRQLIPRSDINTALSSTIANDPNDFWYLNNGITITCDTAKRTVVNVDNTNIGVFQCQGVSVVNGAQTVGVIGEAIGDQDPEKIANESRFADSWVHVRIIPLQGCPPEFDRKITQATNLQNSVEPRDFAAMDPHQRRLATEFALDKKKYAYRPKEERPHDEGGCTMLEAAQALACAHSMDYAVQAKREVGLLLADTMKQPYTDLFNEKTNSIHVWKAIIVMRSVEETLTKLRLAKDERIGVITTHLNRAILHLVFCDPEMKKWRNDTVSEAELFELAKVATHQIVAKVSEYIKQFHDGAYLAALSKNTRKCAAMKSALIQSDGQGSLF